MATGWRRGLRPIVYLWTSPTTAVGLIVGGLTLLTGGKVQRCWGCLEFHGGLASWFFRSTGFVAMTLGHVILGLDRSWLDHTRDHEHVHVRQAELWGPLFLPGYLLASVWEGLRGRKIYRDNWFERDARRRCGEAD